MLLVASCVFYGLWDWRFLPLMFISISVDYICAQRIPRAKDKKTKQKFLILSLVTNLGILGFFKYCNFFCSTLQGLLTLLGGPIQFPHLNIILPVAISFYTFQAMGYIIDVYRGTLAPVKNFWDYALFITYFPQLVAGPIERAAHLLPQILKPRKVRLDWFYAGCFLIFWGLFQKIFIADHLANLVNRIFYTEPYSGHRTLIALYAFAFQIYCDFAGYSNIAIGLGKCMGFDIMTNFQLPYFSANPQEFWKRWHISLSTWLRDYLYIPLGGNRRGSFRTYLNLTLTMLLGGLWHGAQWNFILWGLYHALLLISHRLISPVFSKIPQWKNAFFQKCLHGLKILIFFHLTCFGWLFFRAQSPEQIVAMSQSLFTSFDWIPQLWNTSTQYILFLIGPLLICEIIQYTKNDLMAIYKLSPAWKGVIYFICLTLMLIGGVEGGKEFIYFQF